jgi:hypothetical protein
MQDPELKSQHRGEKKRELKMSFLPSAVPIHSTGEQESMHVHKYESSSVHSELTAWVEGTSCTRSFHLLILNQLLMVE